MIAKARQEAEQLEPESDEPAALYHVWLMLKVNASFYPPTNRCVGHATC